MPPSRYKRKTVWVPRFEVHSVAPETARRVEEAAAADAARSALPKKRKPRPGQQPPQRGPEIPDDVPDYSSPDPSEDDGYNLDSEYESGSVYDAGGSSSQRRRVSRDRRTHRERVFAKQEAWDMERQVNTDKQQAAAARLEESVGLKRDFTRVLRALPHSARLGQPLLLPARSSKAGYCKHPHGGVPRDGACSVSAGAHSQMQPLLQPVGGVSMRRALLPQHPRASRELG